MHLTQKSVKRIVFHMAIDSDNGQLLKAKIDQMEQSLAALKALRSKNLSLPDSVVRAIDEAIADSERKLADLKRVN